MWVLDSGALKNLARATRNSAFRISSGFLHTADSVIQEVRSQPSIPELLNRSEDVGPVVTQHVISIGSAAADMIYGHLRQDQSRADKDLGEDACIALCAVEMTDFIFVTNDARAVLRALLELGPGRVASELDCWHWLLTSSHIDASMFVSLCDLTLRKLNHLPLPLRFRGPNAITA